VQALKALAIEPLADGGSVQTMHVSTYAHMDELKERVSLLLQDDHLWALIVCVPPNTAAVGNSTWLGSDSYWTSAVDSTLMMCVRTIRVFGAMLRTQKGEYECVHTDVLVHCAESRVVFTTDALGLSAYGVYGAASVGHSTINAYAQVLSQDLAGFNTSVHLVASSFHDTYEPDTTGDSTPAHIRHTSTSMRECWTVADERVRQQYGEAYFEKSE
jgi:hypothetical protein